MNKMYLTDVAFNNLATDEIVGVLGGICPMNFENPMTPEVAAANFPMLFNAKYDENNNFAGLQVQRFDSTVAYSIAVVATEGDYEIPVSGGVETFVGGHPTERPQ